MLIRKLRDDCTGVVLPYVALTLVGMAALALDGSLLMSAQSQLQNGVEFNKAGTATFVANTALDWIVKIEVSGGQPGNAAVFTNSTNSINGCDGLAIDGTIICGWRPIRLRRWL